MKLTRLLVILLIGCLLPWPTHAIILSSDLAVGSRGAEVTQLQLILFQFGYSSAAPSGVFDETTAEGVRALQKKYGLSQTGIVDAKVRGFLNPFIARNPASASTRPAAAATTVAPAPGRAVLSFGASGSTVLELQQKLAALGFFAETPTGYFGPVTARAVAAFQTSRGLEPVGYVGPRTSAALASVSTIAPAPTAPIATAAPESVRAGVRPPAVTFRIDRKFAAVGDAVTLSWSAKRAESCSASGGWQGDRGTRGQESLVVAGDTTYTLTCTSSAGGTRQKSVWVSTTLVARKVERREEIVTTPVVVTPAPTTPTITPPVVTPLPTPVPSNDTKPPQVGVITVPKATLTNTSMVVTWTTSEPSITAIEYGLTTAYGQTAVAEGYRTEHRQLISGLAPDTTYHFRVKMIDAAGNVAYSRDRTRVTKAGAVATPIPTPAPAPTPTPTPTPPPQPTPTPTPVPPAPIPDVDTYYVDFAAGADTNPGTMAAPWKHAPGDANATDNPAKVALKSGDTIQFKGGVVYRGQIFTKTSGVTYRGSGWGSGKAVIDGSDPLTTLTRCSSAAACGGNAHWASLYRTTIAIPSFLTTEPDLRLNLMEGDSVIVPAQSPEPLNRFYQVNDNFYTITPAQVTPTSLRDSRLASLGGSSLVGAYLYIWAQPNETVERKITGYNSATNAITFEPISPYTDRNSRYAIGVSPNSAILNQPGEYYLNRSTGELIVWPFTSAGATNGSLTMSVRANGFVIGKHDEITIDGFSIRKQTGDSGREGYGIVKYTAARAGDYEISNNEVAYVNSPEKGGAIGLINADDMVIRDNYVHDILGDKRGISVSGKDITIKNNHVKNVARTGIYFGEVTGGRIENNLVEDSVSTHGNGITVYQNSKDIVVAGNKVFRSNIAFTMEQSSNIDIYNNVFDASRMSNVAFAEWGGMSGTVRLINNTIVGSSEGGALLLNNSEKSTATYLVQNNIIDGGGKKGPRATYSHNIYTSLSWNQSARYGWSLGVGEKHIPGGASLFVAPGSNYALASGSPAVDAGLNLSSILTRDINGVRRPLGLQFDIGAYESR